MNIKFKNIQIDIKPPQKQIKSINDRQSMLLKTVTSYSIFLFVILLLISYLYISDSNNARSQYQWQVKAALMGNAELFEKDLDIMDIYCRQLLQDNRFRKLAKVSQESEEFFTLGYEVSTTMATDVYPEALLPMSEFFCYFPKSGFILSPNYFIHEVRYYSWIKKYPDTLHEKYMGLITSPSYYNCFIPMDEFMPTSSRNYYMYLINMNELHCKMKCDKSY